MKRLGMVLLAFMFALSVSGCSCLKKDVKEEPAPVVEKAPTKAPEPAPKPVPPPKKDRN